VDDHAVAVGEILEQLNMEKRLLKNSVGYITCSSDYVEAGTLEAICKALPFEVTGCTTFTNANDLGDGTMFLSLSVLTADDASFAVAQTDSLESVSHAEAEARIRAACDTAAAKLGEAPKMVLAFLPLSPTMSGELMLEALNSASGGAPVFGSIACDLDATSYSNTFTFYNGKASKNCISLIAVAGKVAPKFVLASISENNIHRQYAAITAAEGSILKEVNGMPAKDYLISLGLLDSGTMEATVAIPFVVNYNDGSQPVARAIYNLNPDGSAACGGAMPQGGTLSIGNLDVDDILLTAEQSISSLLQAEGAGGLLLFSCLGRNMALGLAPMVEVEKVREIIGEKLPWHLAYSGGELCPVYDGDGKHQNRFHNFTFIGCAI
jgi:hypothetical protein